MGKQRRAQGGGVAVGETGWTIEVATDEDAAAILATAGDDTAKFVRQTGDVRWFRAGFVAVAGLRIDSHGGTLCSAWVHPDYRARGIGSGLISARLDAARALGLPWVRTWAFHPAEFERRGFRRGRQTSVGAWYMRLEL